MPRYFFHLLHPGRAPVRDDEGIEFEDDSVARREGMVSLGELVLEGISADPIPLHVSVQIVRQGYGIIDVLTGAVVTRQRT
jgi:hypothetical protein